MERKMSICCDEPPQPTYMAPPMPPQNYGGYPTEPPPNYQQPQAYVIQTPGGPGLQNPYIIPSTLPPQAGQITYMATTTTTTGNIPQQPQTTTTTTKFYKVAWLSQQQRNKPQSKSLSAAVFICLSAGLKIAFSIFSSGVSARPIHFSISWFVAAIIGSLVAAAIVNRFRKKYLVALATLLTIGGGIIQTATADQAAIEASMYLDGIGFGITLVTTTILAGEIASKYNRGILVTIPISINVGMFIQALYTELWYLEYNAFTALQLQGVLSIVFGVMALASTLTILESPIYFLKRNNEAEAVRHIKLLRRYVNANKEVKQTLKENKALIEDDASRTLNENLFSGVPALLKLSLLQGVSTLTFCFPMTVIFGMSSSYGYKTYWMQSTWTPYIYVLIRFIGNVFGCIFILNRKLGITIGFAVCSVLMFIIGGLLEDPSNIVDTDIMTSIASIMICLQFFAGIIEPLIIIYISEAFSLQVKAFYIFVVNMIGYIVQIICLAVICSNVGGILYMWDNAPIFVFITAALQLVMALISIFTLPETNNHSLVVCREMFSKWRWW
ncbi:hypothetical protein ACFFRR_010404 [Megaselia abdita]